MSWFSLLGRGCSFAVVAFLSTEGSAAAQPADAKEPAVTDADAASQARTAAPTRHGSAFVDPLGFALFGPRLGVELGNSHFAAALHARWFNAGLLAHKMFLGDGDDFAFSYGVGARARYYFAEGQSGAHLGLAAEYLHSRTENQAALIATTSAYFVPYVEGGYRIPLGAFYADASAGFGYAARLSSSVVNLPGGSSAALYQASNESSIYGTASLELGVFF